MISIGSNGDKIMYGIKHYNLDTEEDLQRFSGKKLIMGSTCFVISTSKYYMWSSEQKWIEITPFGKAIESNGNNNGENGGTTPPGESDDIVYEGGLV